MRQNLVKLRGNRKQIIVAKELGISQQYLSEIERGIKNPSIKLMKKFEQEYNKTMFELFEDIFLDCNTTNCGNVAKNSA